MLSAAYVALLALCSLTISFAEIPVQIQIGTLRGANNVVRNGEYNLLDPQNPFKNRVPLDSYPLPGEKLFITVTAGGPYQNFTIKPKWLGDAIGTTGNFYIARTTNSWTTTEVWDETVVIQAGGDTEYSIEFGWPTGDAADNMQRTAAGCKLTDTLNVDNVQAKFSLEVAGFVDVDIPFQKQCVWPRISFGTSNITRAAIEDILRPNALLDRAQLTPNAGAVINLTPNTPTRPLLMGFLHEGPEWTTDSQIRYSVGAAIVENYSGDITVNVLESSTGQLRCDFVDTPGNPSLVQLTFMAVCSSTAMTNKYQSMVSIPVYAGFSKPWMLSVFNVTCGESSRLNPMSMLKIDTLATEQLDPAFAGMQVWDGLSVQGLWSPYGHIIYLGQQQQTMGFSFTYSSGVAFTGRISAVTVRDHAVGGSVVRMYDENGDIRQNGLYNFPQTGHFILKLDTLCWSEGIVAFDVLLTDLYQPSRGNYNNIQFRFSWSCSKPKFALSTQAAFLEDLVSQGNATTNTPLNHTVTTQTLAPYNVAITTVLHPDTLTDNIYFTMQEASNNHQFTWTIDPTATDNTQDADIVIGGVSLNSANAAKNFLFSWQSSKAGDKKVLSIDRFTCKKRGTVKLVTWLRYGLLQKTELIWTRDCTDVADYWPGDSSSMSDGAIFGIIVAVLIAVGCLGGVAYNSIKLGKTGLSVIPGVDSFNAWNDGVQGPKRYSSEISNKGSSKSKVADVEIHSLGYGSYQQSDDGYVDEIDTL